MPTPFSLCRPEVEAYINSSFVERVASGITRPRGYSSLMAVFSPPDAPRKAILNRCREHTVSTRKKKKRNVRKLFWLPSFNCWDMSTIGNLSLALLWHVYRTLPPEMFADEKIIYKLGKISVTLPGLTNGFQRAGAGSRSDSERYASIGEKAFPSDKKSSVSSIFSACEQITELSEQFRSIGEKISATGGFDSLVLPVIDIDMCLPEQAVSLLFAIRTFICSERIAVIIAADREILINYLISLYDKSLTQNQGQSLLLSFFDDWVYLPSPSIEKQLQFIDLELTTEEKHRCLNVISKSGFLLRFSDPVAVRHCFHRFNSFLNNTIKKYSTDEYAALLLLFFLGTVRPESLRMLALLPDLERFLKTIRRNSNFRSKGKARDGRVPAAARDDKGTVAHYDRLASEDRDLIGSVVSALPKELAEPAIAKLIATAVSFV